MTTESAEPSVALTDLLDAAMAGDAAAELRDEHATGRDLAAAERDRGAVRAERARRSGHDLAGANASEERATEARLSATRDRDDAALDRGHAARDRSHAARDRRLAAQDAHALTFDELTKTRLRRPGLDALQREIDRAQRTDQHLAVAYVDVDGLKALNDNQGHAAGDELLRSMAIALRSAMRSYDSIVRLGGDEFLCVFPGAGISGARSALDHAADWIVESTGRGSISVGFAELEPKDSRDELIARADQDLIATREQDSASDNLREGKPAQTNARASGLAGPGGGSRS